MISKLNTLNRYKKNYKSLNLVTTVKSLYSLNFKTKLIPSRMSASRLPGKPLLKIDGMSIISRVYSIANESNIGETFVATEDIEIYDEIKKINGNLILK